jgi:hypothetical protein
LPSPTFSLLTGQWPDFHQLADYHASRTAIAPYKATRRPTLPQVSQLLQAIRMCLWFLL